jgi:LPS sulfotransferase NodH
MEEGSRPPLRTDREPIAGCLKDLERRDAGWLKWLEAGNIAPFQLTCEDLVAGPPPRAGEHRRTARRPQ